VIPKSKPSDLIGISGVWNGFFMTASEYISYTLAKTVADAVSLKDVINMNFVPVAVRCMVNLKVSASMTCAPEQQEPDSHSNSSVPGHLRKRSSLSPGRGICFTQHKISSG